MNYVFHLLIYFGVYAILAMGLNLVVGYCGLLTLAHAGYFAVGAYAYALGTLAWGMDSISALLLAFAAFLDRAGKRPGERRGSAAVALVAGGRADLVADRVQRARDRDGPRENGLAGDRVWNWVEHVLQLLVGHWPAVCAVEVGVPG